MNQNHTKKLIRPPSGAAGGLWGSSSGHHEPLWTDSQFGQRLPVWTKTHIPDSSSPVFEVRSDRPLPPFVYFQHLRHVLQVLHILLTDATAGGRWGRRRGRRWGGREQPDRSTRMTGAAFLRFSEAERGSGPSHKVPSMAAFHSAASEAPAPLKPARHERVNGSITITAYNNTLN